MRNTHKFIFNVPTTATAALTASLDHHHRRAAGQKLRRTSLQASTPTPSRTFCEVIVTEPGETTKNRQITCELHVDFVAMLQELGGFTDNVFFPVASFLMEWFRAWLPTVLFGLDEDTMAQFTDDNLQLQTVTGQYLFQASDRGEAIRWYMALMQHCKALLDTQATYPGHKVKMPQRPRVKHDDGSRMAFTVELEHLPHNEMFGQAHVSLMMDKSDFPSGFARSEAQLPQVLRSKASQLLRVEVTVDVSKRLHFGPDTDFKLPRDYKKWTHDHLANDPFQVIWDATRYALWLNLRMPTTEEGIERDGQSQAVTELLNLYLANCKLQGTAWISDENDEERLRARLIQQLGIDILIPWDFAKLNQSDLLGEALQYGNRLVPSDDEDLALHTLSRQNVQEKLSVLKNS